MAMDPVKAIVRGLENVVPSGPDGTLASAAPEIAASQERNNPRPSDLVDPSVYPTVNHPMPPSDFQSVL